jgi:hypothetical protein
MYEAHYMYVIDLNLVDEMDETLLPSMKLGSWMKSHTYIIAIVDVIQPYG